MHSYCVIRFLYNQYFFITVDIFFQYHYNVINIFVIQRICEQVFYIFYRIIENTPGQPVVMFSKLIKSEKSFCKRLPSCNYFVCVIFVKILVFKIPHFYLIDLILIFNKKKSVTLCKNI